MTTVLLAGTYLDNYLTLGNQTIHVSPDTIALAQNEAAKILAAIPPDPPADPPLEPIAAMLPEAPPEG
jgi:hypothetical protein